MPSRCRWLRIRGRSVLLQAEPSGRKVWGICMSRSLSWGFLTLPSRGTEAGDGEGDAMTDKLGAPSPFVTVAYGRSVPLPGPQFPRRKFSRTVFEVGQGEWCPWGRTGLTLLTAVTLPAFPRDSLEWRWGSFCARCLGASCSLASHRPLPRPLEHLRGPWLSAQCVLAHSRGFRIAGWSCCFSPSCDPCVRDPKGFRSLGRGRRC